MSKITFAFGRFNPPTIGHEVLMNKAKAVGGKDYYIYVSKSQDKKKNPLSYSDKIKYLKKIFPVHKSHIADTPARTAIDVAVQLSSEGYTDLIMIAGSDRVGEFQKLLDKYNGVTGKRHGEYKFDSIKVINAGERDPDATGASGMSASKMRGAAADDNFDLFKTGLPDSFDDAKGLFTTLKKAMGIKEYKEFKEFMEIEEGLSQLLHSKEYKAAAKWFKKFQNAGMKNAIALHKAAGMVKGVKDKDLQSYLVKLKLL